MCPSIWYVSMYNVLFVCLFFCLFICSFTNLSVYLFIHFFYLLHRYNYESVCVCVCVCARARARACVRACVRACNLSLMDCPRFRFSVSLQLCSVFPGYWLGMTPTCVECGHMSSRGNLLDRSLSSCFLGSFRPFVHGAASAGAGFRVTRRVWSATVERTLMF